MLEVWKVQIVTFDQNAEGRWMSFQIRFFVIIEQAVLSKFYQNSCLEARWNQLSNIYNLFFQSANKCWKIYCNIQSTLDNSHVVRLYGPNFCGQGDQKLCSQTTPIPMLMATSITTNNSWLHRFISTFAKWAQKNIEQTKHWLVFSTIYFIPRITDTVSD